MPSLLLLPPENEVWGKVMFSHLSFCSQGQVVGFPAYIPGHMTRRRGSASSGVCFWGRRVCIQDLGGSASRGRGSASRGKVVCKGDQPKS